uniref:asparagine synthase (glutamine-hydrolyzing) n=1 Tax=Candidatus Kentrum sp. FW TaxID=2126338 RepID=A0A450U0Q6_9GAMM|nr:MAG: asparagine synthase (glutamine-hydrolysing) [Candidatus Kentron sp. FW]
MCGFVGIVRPGGLHPEDEEQVRRATRALAHRGPDAQGIWIGSHMALGVARLAVRGGQTAAQPLCVEGNGEMTPQAVLAFNGEIYDDSVSARGTDGYDVTNGSSADTRWLAAHLGAHGLDCLADIDGMFAFAYWQPGRRRLFLARDRWGEKPLYWTRLPEGGLAFGSEPGALIPVHGIDWAIEPRAVATFVGLGYWRGRGTPWSAVERLGAGQAIAWVDGVMNVTTWWSPQAETFATVTVPPDTLGIYWHLTSAVGSRLVGERPMGALLSGGLDSSLIVSLAADAGVRLPVWTVRWDNSGWDERVYAAAVGAHLGLEHRWVDFGPWDVPRRIEALVDAYGEPFGDESLLPTSAVLEAASSEVDVVLTGDGGDELFGGYDRYCWRPSAHVEYQDVFCACPRRVLHQVFVPEILDDEESLPLRSAGRNIRDQRRWIDLHGYLSDDLPRKMDRAAGRVGIENRAPFLARTLSRWAMTLSAEVLWWGDVGKQPLRALAAKLLPSEIVRRGKLGFGVPLSPWFRGPLRSWVRDRLLSGTLVATGWIESAGLERILQDHFDGREHSRALFNLLMLAIWLERWPRRLVDHPPPGTPSSLKVGRR